GQRVLLHFGAVDWETKVWVNGKKIGEHRGGYDAFQWDITDALKDAENQELVVGVWDPTDAGTQPRGKQANKPEGIFYTPTTGIWQTAWLEPVPAAHIDRLKIVPDLDAATVRVTVLTGGSTAQHKIRVTARAAGRTGITKTGPVDKPVELKI